MLGGPAIIYILVSTAIREINRNPVIDTKVQWAVFVIIFIPITLGFILFGWFAFKGEYDHLPEKSDEVE